LILHLDIHISSIGRQVCQATGMSDLYLIIESD